MTGAAGEVSVATMGLTIVTLGVADPADPARREPVDFLVDSGAVYSFVPREILVRLGIAPHGRQRFRLADAHRSSASAA